jgi:hypothetical protein
MRYLPAKTEWAGGGILAQIQNPLAFSRARRQSSASVSASEIAGFGSWVGMGVPFGLGWVGLKIKPAAGRRGAGCGGLPA